MPLPLAVPLAIAGAQGLYSVYQGYKQGQKAKELEKRGPVDNVPAAYKQMLANQANQANNAQIAGYGQAIDNLNEQQATTLGEAKRAGTSSSNLLNVLTRLNQQGSAEKRRLAMAGEQAREQRQGQYNQGLMGQSQYQEQARQEQQRAIGALRGASKQNYYNALSTGLGAATTLYGMGAKGGATGTTGATDAALQGVRQNVSDIPTTPDMNELGDMGGSPSILTPTPEMAGLETPNPNLFKNSVPNPYVYQPQGARAYTPEIYNQMYRERFTGQVPTKPRPEELIFE